MSRTLKWILYVLLGLVVLSLIVGVVFAAFGGWGYSMMGPSGTWMWDHMRFGYRPLGGIFVGLLCLGIILLVILGIVALVTAVARGNRLPPATPTPVPPSTTATAPAALAEHPCPNCGRMTQADWKNCPYCGTPLP